MDSRNDQIQGNADSLAGTLQKKAGQIETGLQEIDFDYKGE